MVGWAGRGWQGWGWEEGHFLVGVECGLVSEGEGV